MVGKYFMLIFVIFKIYMYIYIYIYHLTSRPCDDEGVDK